MKRLLVAALIFAAIVGAFELSLLSSDRFDQPDPLGAAVSNPGASPLPSDVVPDNRMLWRNRPGVSATAPAIPSAPGQAAVWNFRVNGDGFRGADRIAGGPVDDLYRILCVGDSVTFGFNVDQGSDYPAVLSRLLAARYPSRRFEVINAGVPEWTWVQGAAFLLHGGFALHPDAVVVAHGNADQSRAAVTDSERIWLNEQLPEQSSLPPWLSKWLTPDTPRARRGESPGCRLQAVSGAPCQRVSRPEIGETVQRIGSAANAAGVELLLVNLDFSGTAAGDAVHQAAIRDDHRFLDLASNVKSDRLEQEMFRSRDYQLAFPRVPLVPLGRIGPPPPDGRGPRVRFRVSGVPSAKAVRVRGSSPAQSGFRFDEELRDDGTEADEKAGDGVYSAFVVAPPPGSVLSYRFFSDGIAEFEAPEGFGKSHTDRTIRFNRDADAPIEIFGMRFLLSDDMHPNVDGQRRIAEDVLREIETFPSFRRFAGPQPPADGEPPYPASAAREREDKARP